MYVFTMDQQMNAQRVSALNVFFSRKYRLTWDEVEGDWALPCT